MATTTNEVQEDGTTYFDECIEPPMEEQEWDSPEEMMAHHRALRESALSKLKEFGLTDAEAKTVIGV